MKKNLYIFMTIIVCLTINGCSHGYSGSVHLQDSHITFKIKDISFQESSLWEYYKNEGVNYLNLCMFVADTTDDEQNINMDLENKDNKNVNLSITFDYDNQPKANFDNKLYYDLDGSSDCDYSILQVTSVLQSVNEYTISEDEKNKSNISSHHIELKNNSLSAIQLKYSIDNDSVIDFELTGEEIEEGKVLDDFIYNVEHEVVHEGDSNLQRMTLIVMAEGYTVDEINWYKKYVADAFKDAASFYYLDDNGKHITNDFFNYYWKQIRIIRMDTISPQSGVDQESGVDRVKSILDYNIAKDSGLRFCNIERIKQIIENNHLESISSCSDIDAVIIFVNDKNCWTYSTSYGPEIEKKYNQPIHPVIVQAPVGYDCDIDITNWDYTEKHKEFHRKVLTHGIAHELGHALARLQDEYIKLEYEYDSQHRNISINENNPKWQKFIDKGYGNENMSVSSHLVGCFADEFPVDTIYYRPTLNSTMNNYTEEKMNIINEIGIQFDPINTYHLVASFKIRTSTSNPNIDDLKCDEDPSHYEWKHYTIDKFKEEWPPSKFGGKD